MSGHNKEFLDQAASARPQITEVAPGEVGQRLEGGAVLIDVRSPEEYASDHIAGSVNHEYQTLAESIEFAVPDKDTPIVAYCGGGNRGAIAALALQESGYRNVTSIRGGFRAYRSAVEGDSLIVTEAAEGPLTQEHRPVDRENAEHYIWGEVSDGWHLLKQPDLSVIHERVPAGAGELRHYHSKARQFFFVLSGSATLELDTGDVTFHAGQGVHVPPGVAHRLTNNSNSSVEFLVISSPTTAGDRTNVDAAE